MRRDPESTVSYFILSIKVAVCLKCCKLDKRSINILTTNSISIAAVEGKITLATGLYGRHQSFNILIFKCV